MPHVLRSTILPCYNVAKPLYEVNIMQKIPISLIIDDPAPRVFVFYEHSDTHMTKDGRPLLSEVPNQLLYDFCDVMEKYGLRGKFSVVPMPGGRGDIVNGIEGFPPEEVDAWLDTVRNRVTRYFSICPEVLTHAHAVDLSTGSLLDMNEHEWARTQTEETLTPYIARAVALHRDARLPASGLTSPWDFGADVEDAYVKSISAAFAQEMGKDDCWYFLHILTDVPNARPWVALQENGRRVVSVPATTSDHIWQTIDSTDTSDAYVSAVADELLTEDGARGAIMDVINSGGWPIVLTHWQSLFSNGLGTGLRVLEEVARRIEKNLSDRVEWKSTEEIMQLVLQHPDQFPKPKLG